MNTRFVALPLLSLVALQGCGPSAKESSAVDNVSEATCTMFTAEVERWTRLTSAATSPADANALRGKTTLFTTAHIAWLDNADSLMPADPPSGAAACVDPVRDGLGDLRQQVVPLVALAADASDPAALGAEITRRDPAVRAAFCRIYGGLKACRELDPEEFLELQEEELLTPLACP